jgi:Cu(I)/Ag(I) efflux system membrane fusion protein
LVKKLLTILRRGKGGKTAVKKNILLIVLSLLACIGILAYLSLSSLLNKTSRDERQRAPSEHSGHTSATAKPEERQEAATTQNGNGTEGPAVEISREKQQLIGVKTTLANIKPLQKVIRTVGRIEYDERRLATVTMKFEGWIEKLYIDYSGKYVKKGDPLVEIYSPELIASQQEYIEMLRWKSEIESSKRRSELDKMLLRDAEQIVYAAKQRLGYWDITEEQIKKIEHSGKPIRALTIHSPVSGYAVQKMALTGMRVMPGERLFDIADLSSVWIIADIYEYELPLIKVGLKTRINLSYLPGKEFTSNIEYVYPVLSADTKTARIRFTLPNHGGQLKPQMFTNIEIKIDLGNRLLIPKDAVIDTGIRRIVYVDKGEGYFEPREVLLGLRDDNNIEVLKGLKSGEKVVSSAAFLVDSEAKLKGIVPLYSR